MAVVLTASPLAACAGTSVDGAAAASSSTSASSTPGISATATPSKRSPNESKVVADAPSRLYENMSPEGAKLVIPKLKKLPGVFRVHYSSASGRLYIYLLANITKKQHDRVLDVASKGTAI